MNYTLHQLRIFTEVVRQESITRAAEEMHMTQPALSIQLKNFQTQFEVPLTEYIGKKMQVTDFGKVIAELAENVLKEADEIKYKTREYNGLLAGKLRISSASTGKYVIPFFLSDFIHQHPGIDLTLDVSNKTVVMKSLRRNDIDFALVSVVPDDLDVDEEILMENKLYLVGNTKKIVKDRPFIYREEGSATRSAMDSYFADKSSRKSIALTSNEAVKQALIAGIGYSIIPLIGMHNELLNEQVNIIPRRGLPIKTHWRLIWLRRKKMSPIAKAYLAFVRETKEDIISKHFDWFVDFEV